MQGKSSLLPTEAAATSTVATNDDCLTYTVAQAARLRNRQELWISATG